MPDYSRMTKKQLIEIIKGLQDQSRADNEKILRRGQLIDKQEKCTDYLNGEIKRYKSGIKDCVYAVNFLVKTFYPKYTELILHGGRHVNIAAFNKIPPQCRVITLIYTTLGEALENVEL